MKSQIFITAGRMTYGRKYLLQNCLKDSTSSAHKVLHPDFVAYSYNGFRPSSE
ncbi:MAG: hypothetical protein LBM67_01550 [Lentimicrobiaceae bacterium]|nr:hypothetical protein [Lentimicrobiaceae bacterium]